MTGLGASDAFREVACYAHDHQVRCREVAKNIFPHSKVTRELEIAFGRDPLDKLPTFADSSCAPK